MPDDQVKIDVQVTGQPAVDALTKSTENYKRLIEELEKDFAKGDVTADEYVKRRRQMTAEIDRQTQAMARFKGGVEEVGKSADKAAKSGADAGRAMLNLGRGIQDFTQGGIPGILNNIEQLTQSLGGGAGLAGVMTAVGVAAYLAGPYLKQFWDYLIGAADVVPKANQGLADYQAQLSGVAKELTELAGKQSLSNDEFDRFNVLAEQQAGLRKKMKEEQGTERRAEQMREFVPKEQQEAGKAFVQEVGQGYEAMLAEVTRLYVEANNKRLAQLEADAKMYAKAYGISIAHGGLMGGDPALKELADASVRHVEEFRQGLAKEAARVIDEAAKGAPGGVEELTRILPGWADRLKGKAVSDMSEKARARNEAFIDKMWRNTEQELFRLMDAADKVRGRALDAWLDERDKELEKEARRLAERLKARLERQRRAEQAAIKGGGMVREGPRMTGEEMGLTMEDIRAGGLRQEAFARQQGAAARRRARRERREQAEAWVGGKAAPTGTEIGLLGGAAAAAIRTPQVQGALADQQRAERLQAQARFLDAAVGAAAANRAEVAMLDRATRRIQQGGEQGPQASGKGR